MINPVSTLGKSAYKCAHCHDYSIILDNADLLQPICPICKGLLRIDDKNTGISHTLTNQLLSLI
jgi:hypothetical protein